MVKLDLKHSGLLLALALLTVPPKNNKEDPNHCQKTSSSYVKGAKIRQPKALPPNPEP